MDIPYDDTERVLDDLWKEYREDDLFVVECLAEDNTGYREAIHRALLKGDYAEAGWLLALCHGEYGQWRIVQRMDDEIERRRMEMDDHKRARALFGRTEYCVSGKR